MRWSWLAQATWLLPLAFCVATAGAVSKPLGVLVVAFLLTWALAVAHQGAAVLAFLAWKLPRVWRWVVVAAAVAAAAIASRRRRRRRGEWRAPRGTGRTTSSG